jgi:hypothetical protein
MFDYRAGSGNDIAVDFLWSFAAMFMVHHNSTPHQSKAVSSMNPLNPINVPSSGRGSPDHRGPPHEFHTPP